MSASLHLAASIARRLGEWQAAIILALGQVTPVDQLGANWGSLLAWADVLHCWRTFSVALRSAWSP